MMHEAGRVIYTHGRMTNEFILFTFYAEKDCDGSRLCAECGLPIISRIYFVAINDLSQYCCSAQCAEANAAAQLDVQYVDCYDYHIEEIVIPQLCAICGSLTNDDVDDVTLCDFCSRTFLELGAVSPIETSDDQIMQDCRDGLTPEDVLDRTEAQICKINYEAGQACDCVHCKVSQKWCAKPHEKDRRHRGLRMNLSNLEIDLR